MLKTNETRHIKWHETCKCKCRLDASVCNNKQRWNDDKCRCECKELIDKGVCDKGYIWNPSNCECEYDKSCDVGEYLDYENCQCRKKLADKLVEECTETVEELKIISENKKNAVLAYCTLSQKNIGIYNIGYIAIKKIDDCEGIYHVNPLYLKVNHANGYIQEKNVNKYLIFDTTDENKELLKNMQTSGMELKTKSMQ